MRPLSLVLLSGLASLILVACGDDDTDVVIEPTVATETATASPTATPEPTAPPNTSQSLESTIVTFHTLGDRDIAINAEIADSPSERSVGLMNRETLGEDAGMLFVFPETAVQSFWMQRRCELG